MKTSIILVLFSVILVLAESYGSEMSVNDIPVVYYEEVKDVPNHPEKVLIDVREPHELIETGVIPKSVNIPLNSVGKAFSEETSGEEFKKLYGIEKPSVDTYLIITCRSGRRSQIAAEKIKGLGYRKVNNYKGSWLDWEAKEKKGEKEV